MALLTGSNVANVERVEIVTEETPAKTYAFETATTATFTPAVSAGQETEQRIKNRIMGLLKTNDVLKGYDITLGDDRLNMEIFALMNGGTVATASELNTYTGPAAGSAAVYKAFTLNIYTSDRGTDAEVNNYHKWSFTHCKGKPVTVNPSDNAFAQISYTIESRPAAGSATMTVTETETLPTVS